MKNVVCWNVAPCGSYKNGRFGKSIASIIMVIRMGFKVVEANGKL
jgi:hypothetical protein